MEVIVKQTIIQTTSEHAGNYAVHASLEKTVEKQTTVHTLKFTTTLGNSRNPTEERTAYILHMNRQQLSDLAALVNEHLDIHA